MPTIAWPDAVGLVGVLLILVAYFLLQAGRVRGDGLSYQLMNLFGAAAVLVSLAYKPNVSAIVMEASWVAVSLYGIVRGLRGGKSPPR